MKIKFDPHIHHRRSIRLKGYDYSQPGAYFITLVTHGRDCIFGEVIEGDMVLNWYGKTVHRDWMDLPHHYPFVTLDAFIVMPNHVHAIVVLRTDDVGRGGSTQAHNSKLIKFVSDRFVTPDVGQTRPYGIRRHGLPEIVRAFKSFSARRINQKRHLPGIAVWQRNYYEHIIRNQSDLDCIRLYIGDNPRRWAEDPENQK
jgi:putative transposase